MMEKNSVEKFFDDIPVYVINLPDCHKRRESVISQFAGYDNLHFIEAVDGRNPDTFSVNYNVTYTAYKNFTLPVIAVICSHAKAIRTAYDNGNEMACIFEDDIKLDLLDKCDFTIRDIIKTNNKWDAIQLYYSNNLINNYNHFKKNGLDVIKRDDSYFGTCYLINRNGMRKILKDLIVTDGVRKFNIINKINNPEDIILSSINTYIINKPCLYYAGSDSITFTSYFQDKNVSQTSNKISPDRSRALKAQNNAAEIIKSFYAK